MKSGNLNLLEPSGPLQACNGTVLPLPFTIQNKEFQIMFPLCSESILKKGLRNISQKMEIISHKYWLGTRNSLIRRRRLVLETLVYSPSNHMTPLLFPRISYCEDNNKPTKCTN